MGLFELDVHNAQRAHVIEVCREFHAQGHEVLLLAPKPRNDKETFPFKVVHVPFWGYGELRLSAFYFFLAVYAAYFIVTFKPDCVYEREMESLFPLKTAFLMKIPVFVEVGGWAAGELEDLKTPPRKILYIRAVQKKKFHKADGLIAIVSNIKENIIREYNAPAEKIIVLPNGANTVHFYPVQKEEACGKLGLSLDTPTLGYVGNFQPWHGLNILIKAFNIVHQKNPAVTLIMAGTGSVFEECKSLVQKFNLTSNVVFTGQLTHDRIPLFIGAFDICLYTIKPGQTIFGSPLKIWEYMACGRPVISHLLPESPIPEQLHQAILVVPPGNPEALAEAVTTLLHDPERRARMGNKGREIAEKYFSWESIVKRKLPFMEGRMKQHDV